MGILPGHPESIRQENLQTERKVPERLGMLNKAELQLLNDAYRILANIHNRWEGRHTAKGQKLLCDLRDKIAEQTGRPAVEVQDNISK
jgi:hypothetical protein